MRHNLLDKAFSVLSVEIGMVKVYIYNKIRVLIIDIYGLCLDMGWVHI